MKFPLRSTIQIGSYVAKQKRAGARFPLVLMLEPTLACNIACIGCGKIREYESNKARLSVEECVDAGVQCPAPVVSICGGEPLVYKGIDEVVTQVLELGKTIELCTNALRLEHQDERIPLALALLRRDVFADRDRRCERELHPANLSLSRPSANRGNVMR